MVMVKMVSLCILYTTNMTQVFKYLIKRVLTSSCKFLWAQCIQHLSVSHESSDVTCPRLEAPPGGKLVSLVVLYVPGDVVEVSCNEGTIPNGTLQRVCQPDGTWNGTPASCQGKEKLIPKVLEPCGESRVEQVPGTPLQFGRGEWMGQGSLWPGTIGGPRQW